MNTPKGKGLFASVTEKNPFLFAMINCKTFTIKQVNSIFFLQVEKNPGFF